MPIISDLSTSGHPVVVTVDATPARCDAVVARRDRTEADMTAAIDRGATDIPLLEQTIGENLAAIPGRVVYRNRLIDACGGDVRP